MSPKISIYCKSYRKDLKRAIRLTESICQFNLDRIPFYLSVPRNDIDIFRNFLPIESVNIIEDESIVHLNSDINKSILDNLPGNISQQIIKSEFWRLNISDNYLCIDSDAIFIRPFRASDFLWTDNVPYTVMDESHELFEAAIRARKLDVLTNFYREAELLQRMLDRPGKAFAFGPFPIIWNKAVWQSLEKMYLQPHNKNIMDAIVSAPIESRWYGEALLKFRAIPLVPCQPLFKVYHYAWQMDQDHHAGVRNEELARFYSGVIYQSAWERDMDWPTEIGSLPSRIARRIRRKLGRI